MEELLKELEIKKIEKWHTYSIFNGKKINYFGFKKNGIDYCVSQSANSYVFSKIVKGHETMLYMGFSKNDLESVLRKELCMQN